MEEKNTTTDLFKSVTVLDGGVATELQEDGYKFENDCLWSARLLITCPEAVVKVHKKFLEAGAQIIETNSYHAAIKILLNHGISYEKSIEILQSSVTLAKEAVESFKKDHPDCGQIFIAGSVGPYASNFDNLTYEGGYVDKVTKNELIEYHLINAKTLVEMGIDILSFETIPAMVEAECILQVLDEIPDIPAWICFTCKNSEYLSHGERFSDAIALVAKHPRVVAVGVNCTDPQFITDLLKSAHLARNGKPFVVYPNKGEVYQSKIGWKSKESDKRKLKVEEYVKEWIDCGAKVIGGCCRIHAKDIENIKKAVEQIELNV